RPTEASYSSSSSFLTAAICRRSNSVTLTECHRSAARMSAPNINFKTALSPNAFGMILSRRRSSTKRRSSKFVVRIARRCVTGKQMGDAGFEVIDEAGNRAIVLAAIVGNDPGRELARNGSARRLIGRLRAYLELRPDVFRHLGRQIAHAMRQATLPSRPRKANFDRLDDARSAIRGHQ